MERNQLCVANVRYKKPSADGTRQAKSLLRYLTYRDSRDERAPQRGGQERWIDQEMGGCVADIADRCADLRSDHVLSFSLVINPNPDLIALLDQTQREQFVRELTERTVEGFFEARGIDTGIEYSYVTHRRLTDDAEAPGRANPHTHVVLPGTVYSEEHGARVPLYFSQNKKVNHIDLLHRVTETEMDKLLTREVGRDWEQRFDALEEVRAQERRVVERPADGRLAERAGQGTEFWIGTRQQNETHSGLGYYCLDSEGNTQFRTLVSGLPAQEAVTLARGLRAASHGDFQTYQAHIRTVQLLTTAQRVELCAEFDRVVPDFEPSPLATEDIELSLWWRQHRGEPSAKMSAPVLQIYKDKQSMTQNNGRNKPAPIFFDALFHDSAPGLYLELRCIHPTSGEVKTLWAQLGDESDQTKALTAAERLNAQGYGVYFAPCLRRERRGKANTAAVLPALWVDLDCDDDAVRRAAALEKLQSFNVLPSAIIDSGGGVHAYWMLAEPVALADDSRKQAAGILRGLFSTLGGDPQYVKSVASVMRLPGSVNTKPERGGAVVTLLELHLERRYPLSDFLWLESQPQVERISSLNVVALNGNGHHSLPKRTEDYLAAGAPVGSRNTELFAAVCQLRDAGCGQSEAERQLVPRYVADGCSEREALATIRSAFGHPPREPILTPQNRVDQLVQRYSRRAETQEHPAAAQIAETVRSCAQLNPVEWAEVRQRLKSVCGDGLKVADLDRLYRETRRNRERAAAPQGEDAERYVEQAGGMVYEKATERGVTRHIVADWTGRVLEWRMQIDDDGQIDRQTRLQLTHATYSTTVDAPDELFGDPNALARFIAGKAGGIFSPRAGMQKHLAPAILKLSADAPRRQTYRFVGWTRLDDHWLYVSPEVTVSANGVMSAPPEVALENRLHDYGLKQTSWEAGLAAFRAAAAVFPQELASVLIAFALLPLVQRFLPSAAPKPALHLVGTTGSGKSEIAALMTSFYGEFTRDTPPAQWGDTVNTVEALGYTLADALYWVDDYKTCYADERTFTRFLQSYSRGMGRGRLTREAKLRQERPCRGLLLSTGETTIEGEASILSRMLVLEIPPWEQRDPGGVKLADAEAVRRHLPGFTAAFSQWLAARADAGTLLPDLADRYELNAAGYSATVQAKLGRQAHTGRMITNWAVLVTVYQLLRDFLGEQGAHRALPVWQDAIVETVKTVQQERAGQVFLDKLTQLVASGRVMFASSTQRPEEPRPGVTIIGYLDDAHVLLLPDIAFQEVARGEALKFSATDIGKQLREDGWLIPGSTSLTVQRRVRGLPTRFWQLKADFLGCDGCDSVTG